MARAGDARVIIPYRLLTHPGKLVVGEIAVLLDEVKKIPLYDFLVLGGGGNNPGIQNDAIFVQLIAMPADTPGGLCTTIGEGLFWLHFSRRLFWHFIRLDKA
jgi:hypothetical protein